MGIFDRFRRVVKSNINDMISKAENPEKMLNQLIVDMNQNLIESKKSVAAAIADEKKLERQVKENIAAGEEWERKAMLAVRAGKDDLAKEALLRKQSFDKAAAQYKEQWDGQREAVEKLKVALRGLQQKIEEATRKKNLLIARSKRAEAQKRINETITGIGDTSAFEAFEQMSKRMDTIEAQNEAMLELQDMSGAENLEQEFAKLEAGGGSADRMLADLKKKLALEDKRGDGGEGSGSAPGASDASSADPEVDEELEALKRKLQGESST